ncbi:MAG: chitobiase/beta-hexosaminidase C-terminal domain-containing protein [Candidatus Syntrophosphaera sp.]
MIKKILGSILILGFVSLMFAQAADLFFSEYVEGTSNNKALEIFNGTGDAVDLSQYTIKLASNGNTWSTTNVLTPSGTLANGDVFVIANAGADAPIQNVADVTSTVTYYNGNDCLGLFNGTTLIDIIGVYQQDPGAGWPVAGVDNATGEHTLIRKPEVVQGNIDFLDGAGTNQDDSEWIVHPQNYFDDLGQHTFDPGGGNNAATPTFDPPGGVYASPITVSISCDTPDADIYYTLDGNDPDDSSTPYASPIPVDTNTTLKARAYADGFDPSYVATASYSFPVSVADLAALRASDDDGTTVYYLAGEALLTFQQDFRHQKYIQDNTAAVLIDDYNGVITTQYEIGDGITGISGTLSRYAGMLQFSPTTDPGPATSTGNSIPTPVLTIQDILTNLELYQSRLVRINDVHFENPTGNYANGQDYPLIDATGSIIFRTQFYDVDYIGTPMHQGEFDLRAIVNQYNTTPQVIARMLADFNPPVANDDDTAVPANSRLIGNYPNPFNPQTTIEFFTDKASEVRITIFNQKGQAIRTLNADTQAKGTHSIVWDGTDDKGQSVSSGVYYYHMHSGKYSSTRKMVLMK